MSSSEAEETKSIITGVLTSNPLRCTIKQLCDDFRNIVGYNIPIRKLGFPTVEHYLRSIPDTVRITGSGMSAEVHGVVKQKSAHMNQLVAKQKTDSIPANKRRNLKKNNQHIDNTSRSMFDHETGPRIPKRIQNNLRKLILKFPDGILCTKLATVYRNMFGEELRHQTFNYRSIIEMCVDLPEVFHYVSQSSDDWMLFDVNSAYPPMSQNDVEKKEDDAYFDLDWFLGNKLIPPDIVPFLTEIPRMDLEKINVGDYIDIEMGEIYDISEFWIYAKQLDFHKISGLLQDTFHPKRNLYTIPQLFLEEGLYCIIHHKNRYYRGVIADSRPKKQHHVKVLFIDIGTVCKVDIANVWYMPEEFGDFPCQAIKAKLFDVYATSPIQTTDKFKQLVQTHSLLAEVMKVDLENKSLEIYLADISDENNIFYINDKLAEKGYAEYC